MHDRSDLAKAFVKATRQKLDSFPDKQANWEFQVVRDLVLATKPKTGSQLIKARIDATSDGVNLSWLGKLLNYRVAAEVVPLEKTPNLTEILSTPFSSKFRRAVVNAWSTLSKNWGDDGDIRLVVFCNKDDAAHKLVVHNVRELSKNSAAALMVSLGEDMDTLFIEAFNKIWCERLGFMFDDKENDIGTQGE